MLPDEPVIPAAPPAAEAPVAPAAVPAVPPAAAADAAVPPATPPASETPPAAAAAAPAAVPTTPESPTPPPGTDGAPAAPKAIDATSLKAPDGSHFTPQHLDVIARKATTLGMTPEQAQQFVDAEAADAIAFRQRQREALEADPELGGANLQATADAANRALELALKGHDEELAEFRAFLDITGLGNNKAYIRSLARFGRMLAEDRPPITPGTNTKPKDTTKPLAERLFGDAVGVKG